MDAWSRSGRVSGLAVTATCAAVALFLAPAWLAPSSQAPALAEDPDIIGLGPCTLHTNESTVGSGNTCFDPDPGHRRCETKTYTRSASCAGFCPEPLICVRDGATVHVVVYHKWVWAGDCPPLTYTCALQDEVTTHGDLPAACHCSDTEPG